MEFRSSRVPFLHLPSRIMRLSRALLLSLLLHAVLLIPAEPPAGGRGGRGAGGSLHAVLRPEAPAEGRAAAPSRVSGAAPPRRARSEPSRPPAARNTLSGPRAPGIPAPPVPAARDPSPSSAIAPGGRIPGAGSPVADGVPEPQAQYYRIAVARAAGDAYRVARPPTLPAGRVVLRLDFDQAPPEPPTVRVARSSGDPRLDAFGVELLRRAVRGVPVPETWPGRGWHLELPFENGE